MCIRDSPPGTKNEEAPAPVQEAEEPAAKEEKAKPLKHVTPAAPPSPKKAEDNMDSDLQAKLAARRARAEDAPGGMLLRWPAVLLWCARMMSLPSCPLYSLCAVAVLARSLYCYA
eukprot:2358856-Rhodomonas_salina.1